MGAVLSEMVFCRACGKEIHKTARACPHCGAQQADGSGKSKVAAAVLAFFLGAFGVHRFYLGQWWGIFYLLFFWTFIPGIVALIETVVFLLTDDAKWDEKYNGGRPSSGGSGAVIVVVALVGVFVSIAIIGILAAVAIPAYQDYTIRAKMQQVSVDGDRIALAASEFLETQKAIPADAAALGMPSSTAAIRSVSIDQKNGNINLTLGFAPLEGKHFVLTPSVDDAKKISWACGSDEIKQSYLPQKCRQKQ
jgi:TM2 domain-containing membrane protein YozV/Tfp pilus assembly protein PilE